MGNQMITLILDKKNVLFAYLKKEELYLIYKLSLLLLYYNIYLCFKLMIDYHKFSNAYFLKRHSGISYYNLVVK